LANARIAVLGISIDDPCGVRDHAALLAEQLAEDGLSCSLHWLRRRTGSLAEQRAQVRTWLQETAQTLTREPPDAILLHYSVFAFAHRGVPLFARPVVSTIAQLNAPMVCFMHEYAYPWRLGGARGKVWAATQRGVLHDVVSRSAALVVSADARAEWLRSRAWLPRRPTTVAPVFSNLPRAAAPVARAELGLFGYGHEGVAVDTVLDALRLVREHGSGARLVLLGAPGVPSEAAARWQRQGAERGLSDALVFSGRLPAQELADALAGCEVLLFAERGGPTSRKTTLAASLSSGRPVVALDGHSTWRELSAAGAVALVADEAPALGETMQTLLAAPEARERQGELGRAFCERTMSVQHAAQVVGDALTGAIGRAAG
jgi:glycosyltransferase involved in cell wall biosynthesis